MCFALVQNNRAKRKYLYSLVFVSKRHDDCEDEVVVAANILACLLGLIRNYQISNIAVSSLVTLAVSNFDQIHTTIPLLCHPDISAARQLLKLPQVSFLL